MFRFIYLFLYFLTFNIICFAQAEVQGPPPFWKVKGNIGTTAPSVAIGTAINNNFLGTTDAVDFAVATSGFERLRILAGGNIGVRNKLPIQELDINGRLAVQNGVIQRGGTTINASSDLGLYSQIAGNWIRLATNAAPIKFFTDQGGGNSAGTNALVNIDNSNGGGVKIAANNAGTLNATTPDSKAILDLESTEKGVLFPRLTTTERDAITSPSCGLHIFNTTEQCLQWYDCNINKWNSYCRYCNFSVTISSNATALDFYNFLGTIGIARGPWTYCVTINAGVTIQASTQGGSALTFANMPDGARIYLENKGRVVGGGGNGGIGGVEGNTTTCSSQDGDGGTGQNGGNAIVTKASVPLYITNSGLIAGGGGGGGGGDGGCCSAAGGGGGGAGIPAGNGGAGRSWQCASGFVCVSCGQSGSSSGGAVGNSPVGIANATGGNGGNSSGNTSSSGCSTQSTVANNGGNGGNLGGTGGSPANLACGSCSDCRNPGAGGAAGFAVFGGNGTQLTNTGGGLSFGAVQ